MKNKNDISKSDSPRLSLGQKWEILKQNLMRTARYCWTGVWRDPRSTLGVRVIKTLNLSVRSFLDRGLQSKSMALTYSTILAIVPALALLVAILKGFGFQNLVSETMARYLPGKEAVVDTAMTFVNHYLEQASSGVFVGIGIVVLLWTLISLLSNIEDAFNNIWGITISRSMYQKITDYIAICLIVPILLICSSGISIFMSTTLQEKLHLAFLSPLVNVGMELMPVVFAWLAFTFSFFLIPNTKVKFNYAAVSGAICSVGFQILQLLFVNGQIYVSKYNAIYGSFSFLPLLLVWLQFSWLILLFGCVLTFSLQNVFAFNYLGDLHKISAAYLNKLTIAVTAIVYHRFADEKPLLTRSELSKGYNIPVRIVAKICGNLKDAGLVNYVDLGHDRLGIAPAVDAETLSIARLMTKLGNLGQSNFIPGFDTAFQSVSRDVDSWLQLSYSNLSKIRILDIPIPTTDEIKELIEKEAESFAKK